MGAKPSGDHDLCFDVVQNAPFAICLVNKNGGLDYVNPALFKITGATNKWISNLNVFEVPVFKKIGLSSSIRKGFKGEHFRLGPVEYKSAFKGRLVYRVFTGVPIFHEGENKVLVIIEDITEYKRTEEKLLYAYKLNRDIVDKAPFGIYTINDKGLVDYVNPAMIEMSGRPLNKFIGLDTLNSKNYKAIGLSQKIKQGLKGKYFKIGPVNYTSSIGRKTTIRIFTGVPLIEESERKLLLIVEDITEIKKAEESLKESEAWFRGIIDSANDAIVMLDSDMRISLWNKAAEKLFGYDKVDVIGISPTIFMQDDYHETFIKIFNDLLGTKVDFTIAKPFESSFINSGGNSFPAEFSVSLVKLKGRSYVVLIIRDVTVLNEIQRIRVDIQKDKDLERIRNRLLMMITHELKQPITPIIGFANLIKKRVSDPKLLSYVKGVTDSAERMRESVKKVMNFMKLESGDLSFNFKKVNLAKIIAEVLGYKDPFIKLRKIQVVTELENVFIKGDYSQLSEVFENLIDNAVKFSNQGGIIKVRSWKNGDRVFVSVKDHGKGIKQDEVPFLFNKFYQTEDGLSIGGFGLGLAICDEVIKAHNGLITVETDFGKGSEFIVSFNAL